MAASLYLSSDMAFFNRLDTCAAEEEMKRTHIKNNIVEVRVRVTEHAMLINLMLLALSLSKRLMLRQMERHAFGFMAHLPAPVRPPHPSVEASPSAP